jgi:hypothetical protein
MNEEAVSEVSSWVDATGGFGTLVESAGAGAGT